VPASHPILIAGAGIGGLTAAVALAQAGFDVAVIEQAEHLEEAGAGIQLSPNATDVLINLGLHGALKSAVVTPREVRIMAAGSAKPIARVPLGDVAADRYGAPYWVIHRADLQDALFAAASAHPNIEFKLGSRIETLGARGGEIAVASRHNGIIFETRGCALIGADGLWSTVRARLGDEAQPVFAKRTAWRALVPAFNVPDIYREPIVHLWLGRNVHLVHYPVRGGREINIVMIVHDSQPRSGWTSGGQPADLIEALPDIRWAREARAIFEAPKRWQTWSLFDRPVQHLDMSGPVTLLGDAAHPMLPFLAQGAAMAMEDAVVLSDQLVRQPDDIAQAMRNYENLRQARTARTQKAARKQGRIYQMAGPTALARNLVMRALSGRRMLARQDWLYRWTPD